MDNITASEIAGFGVGTLLLCATIAAPKIDALISASQRSSLGMCKRCGDLKMIACGNCKGSGLIKSNGLFGLNLMEDSYKPIGGSGGGGGGLKVKSVACAKCGAMGHFGCPECSKIS